MSKERLVAFTDAVIAIIVTILILEFEKPTSLTWAAVWDLRMNLFAYTISFFWIGTMWVNMHRTWDNITSINNKLVWISLLLLFFSSFFPYTTNIVATNFNNSVAQALYGIVVLLVSLTNVWMYQELAAVAEDSFARTLAIGHNRIMVLDIALKLLGLILTLTVFPSAMKWSVLITALVLIIPRSL